MTSSFSVAACARPSVCGVVAALLLAVLAAAPARAQLSDSPQRQARIDLRGTDLSGKDGPFRKVGYDLALLYRRHERFERQGGVGTFTSQKQSVPLRGGAVVIDAVARPGQAEALRQELEAAGLREAAVAGVLVSGLLPIEAIEEVASIGALRFARPAAAVTRAGSVTSQGVRSLGAAQARQEFGVDGSGITVGTLSDSYDCRGEAAGDVTSGDLPGGVTVLKDLTSDQCTGVPGGTDEGRAMMQLTHDVAPGASQSFHTAFLGRADFANGIRRLAQNGAGVVVDDVIYLAEPFFQDGVISQAVDGVVAGGAAYFSSAGNNSNLSYESVYRGVDPSEAPPVISPDNEDGELHDFDPGPGIDAVQSIEIPIGTQVQFSFQWDQPYASAGGPGSQSDIDVALVTKDGNLIEDSDPNDNVAPPIGGADNIDGDPVELLEFTNNGSFDVDGDGEADTEFGFVIEYFSGPKPDLVKYVIFAPSGFDTSNWEYFTNSSTLFGHANADGAEAIGAAAYFNTPAFNGERTAAGFSALQNGAIINTFSALGGVPILFDEDGSRRSEPLVRQKPEVVGPDAGNTTFFGADLPADPFDDIADDDSFGNFFGTSAAAPHVAGVAALMLSRNAALGPREMYSIMERTADDMDAPSTEDFDEGFDFRTGFGFVRASAALNETQTFEFEGAFDLQGPMPNPFRSQARVQLVVDESQDVRIDVFDVLGRRVASLYDGRLRGNVLLQRTFDGRRLPSGIYFVRILGEEFEETRRAVLVR